MKKGILLGVFTLACVVALSVGFLIWRSKSAKQVEVRRFQEIKTALQAGQFAQAEQLLQQRPAAGAVPERDWAALEIAVLSEMEPTPLHRLTALYWRVPEAFANQERATLLVGRALLAARDLENLKKLRVQWFGRESLKTDWYQLDIDALLASGRKSEAEKVLSLTQLPGAADAERLTRLAILKSPEAPAEAARLLQAAVAADPKNPRSRSLRAQFLEGKKEYSGALAEYSAALAAEPGNDFYRDQLGEFYRRYGKYDEALQVWSAGLTQEAPKDFLILKSLFWSRMVRPLRENVSAPAGGDLAALVEFIQAMPGGYNWNETAFATVPEARRFEQTRPEVFWLKLFSALKQGDESKALGILIYNPFQEHSWNPELERALLRILVYRSSGVLKFPLATKVRLQANTSSPHVFFQELNRWTGSRKEQLPPEVRSLLDGPNAFAAAFLAAGWREAALQLGREQKLTADLPGWYPYELGLAILINHGPARATDFARRSNALPAVQLMESELLLARGKSREAIDLLKRSAPALPASLAPRAALILAVGLIAQEQFSEAEEILQNHPALLQTDPGRDLLQKLTERKQAAKARPIPVAASSALVP